MHNARSCSGINCTQPKGGRYIFDVNERVRWVGHVSLNGAASSCARQCISVHVLNGFHRCEYYRWPEQRKDTQSGPKCCNGNGLTCCTGGLFCTQVATTSAARHLMEACESCSRLNSVGRPPMVCRSEAACSNVSGLAGGNCSVDNVSRYMQE